MRHDPGLRRSGAGYVRPQPQPRGLNRLLTRIFVFPPLDPPVDEIDVDVEHVDSRRRPVAPPGPYVWWFRPWQINLVLTRPHHRHRHAAREVVVYRERGGKRRRMFQRSLRQGLQGCVLRLDTWEAGATPYGLRMINRATPRLLPHRSPVLDITAVDTPPAAPGRSQGGTGSDAPPDVVRKTNYQFNATDRFTPTSEQSPPLKGNIENPELWGTTPEDYVIWFNDIWQKGDPTQWGPHVFTSDAVMIDSTGTSRGPQAAASDFLLLFKYFPNLRGEVISWADNDSEILINWRFVVANDRTVPVVDKFSFVKGKVSFRLAYFDTITLLSYLAENFGSGDLVDYMVDRFWRSAGGGGILFLPGLLWALLRGVFKWTEIPPDAPVNLEARASHDRVALRWDLVAGATSYRVKRSTTGLAGPYSTIAFNVPTNTYEDRGVTSGHEYFYVVSSNSKSTPVPPAPPGATGTEEGGYLKRHE